MRRCAPSASVRARAGNGCSLESGVASRRKKRIMGIAKSASRKTPLVRPQLTFILGSALTGAVAVLGCTDEDPPVFGAVAGAAGKAAGGESPMNGGTSGGGAGGGGTNGGTGTAGSGGAPLAGSGGTGGSPAGGGTAGGGNGGSGGSGGSAGSGVVCPADAGAGGQGEEVANPTGDTDLDGVANCLDGCPEDISKTEPGQCGCGVADVDGDGDGAYDCDDGCPADPMKSAAGVCGCGLSDTANADNDAAVDCKDACPRDPALTEAGACGCLPASLGALCLAHRYQFDGTGTVAADTIGGATGDGVVVGTTLSDTGTLVLAGGSTDQYVQLPARLISALGDSATIEAWITWAGTGGSWQRIFDFGTSDAGADMQGEGRGYLFLTPRTSGGVFRVAISALSFGDEDVVSATSALPATTLTHVAVVVDGATKTLSLYQDGAAQGTAATIRPTTMLSRLEDSNNWLGRSQFKADEELAATYHELRIYSRALTAAEIAANASAGPDALP
jgi:hypothetical protein